MQKAERHRCILWMANFNLNCHGEKKHQYGGLKKKSPHTHANASFFVMWKFETKKDFFPPRMWPFNLYNWKTWKREEVKMKLIEVWWTSLQKKTGQRHRQEDHSSAEWGCRNFWLSAGYMLQQSPFFFICSGCVSKCVFHYWNQG